MADDFKPPRSKSIVRTARSATTGDAKARARAAKDAARAPKNGSTVDSFVNFAHNLGVGADNAMSSSSYGFNPISRNRTLLEWIHRGSWIGGTVVDCVADDMTRAGIEQLGSLDPDDIQVIDEEAVTLGIWNNLNDTIKWARLYGGGLSVILIDGQDPTTPLRMNTIRKDQFRGLLSLDRWMVEPSLSELITDYGPNLGLPKYYTVTAQAPALSGMKIHHSRCVRLDGIRLPYWQRLMENLWGLSVLERLYDRMVAFDSATTGAAQLVYKSYLRTLKVKDMRELIAAGGESLAGLTRYVDMMRRFQGIEGMTVIDAEDDFSADSHSAFSGLSDALQQFGQQLSGASGIPLVRLFGQSPAGFSTGETDLRNYYDTILQQQEKELRVPVTKIYRCIAASKGIQVPDGYRIEFRNLWKLSDEEKSNIAKTDTDAILAAEAQGTIDHPTALKELRQSSTITGRFTNITDEMIKDAEDEPAPDPGELLEATAGESVKEEPEGGEKEKTGDGLEDPRLAQIQSLKAKLKRLGDPGAGGNKAQATRWQNEIYRLEDDIKAHPFKTKDSKPQAAGILYIAGKRVLILKRANDLWWDLPGGGVEKGETPLQAAGRESFEEVKFTPNAIFKLVEDDSGPVNYTTFLSMSEQFVPKLCEEHTDYKWVDIEDAIAMPLHPGLKKVLELQVG